MKVIATYTLSDLGFQKKGKFPEYEKTKIKKSVEQLNFKNYNEYINNFEKYLAEKLASSYTADQDTCKVFKESKSRIRVDLFNPKLKIAIEVEKTKETTLLLDIIKFIIGNTGAPKSQSIIEYGVLIIPDRYRNENHPDGQGSYFIKRLKNELAFVDTILFVKDIFVIVYDTSQFFVS